MWCYSLSANEATLAQEVEHRQGVLSWVPRCSFEVECLEVHTVGASDTSTVSDLRGTPGTNLNQGS